MNGSEVRSILTEIRAVEDDQGRWVVGYGLVFNQWSQDLGGFRERILPGAVDGALAADLVVCANHDPNNVLGRVSAGTVRVTVDDHGVEYRALVNENDPFAVAFYERIARGDINGSSFQFWCEKDAWYLDGEGNTCRDIVAFRTIDEMGPVTFPAYLQTSTEARARVDELRASDFEITLEANDAQRAASWTRFYQLESALETTILDCLFDALEDSAVEGAIDQFAAAAREWFKAHREKYGHWYPSSEDVRAAIAADVERRAAIHPEAEQRDDAVDETDTDEGGAPTKVPETYYLGLALGGATVHEE